MAGADQALFWHWQNQVAGLGAAQKKGGVGHLGVGGGMGGVDVVRQFGAVDFFQFARRHVVDFAVVVVEVEARIVAAADDRPQPVALVQDQAGVPQVHGDFRDLAGCYRCAPAVAFAGARPRNAVGDEHRAAVGLKVGQAHGPVGVGHVGFD